MTLARYLKLRGVRSLSTLPKDKGNLTGIKEKSFASADYQFLQESPVNSEYFQSSLFRLPIPKLQDTCSRYLATQKQLLDEKTYEITEKNVKAFMSQEGPQLQKRLVQKDKNNKETSYISGPWFDMYLKDRRPVSFTHNPGLSLINDPREEFNRNPPLRMASVIISILRFHKSLQAKKLYPDVFHMKPHETDNAKFWSKVKWMPKLIATPLAYYLNVYPLDMSQFSNVLNSTRLPLEGKDAIQSFADSKHLVILHKGRLFSFDGLDENGDLMEPGYYLSAIHSILHEKDHIKSQDIGALTSLDRDKWTNVRKRLVELGNAEKLREIDSAIITICLDSWDFNEENPEQVVSELCCGSEPSNRWFDKAVSMIFSRNGLLGINFEHAWGKRDLFIITVIA